MRILMLGNSLTTAHDLPRRLAETLGADVLVHARGGARLAEHLNPSTKMGQRTAAALVEGDVDVVVLQEMSHHPASNPERYQASAIALCERIRQAGAMPVLYATWAYADTCPRLAKLGWAQEEMHQRMQASFGAVQRETGCVLANVGKAFYERDDATLYAQDGIHPSPAGVALAVEVLAACLAD